MSTTSSGLRRSSSTASRLPLSIEAKPHWGLRWLPWDVHALRSSPRQRCMPTVMSKFFRFAVPTTVTSAAI
ncbi:hypothetical protein, partial [Actinomadura alba]|uniref:hypothetical protein n=1 Tax=Actinomadura alba TaxID=406431 RepID=UPI0031D89E58